MKVLERWNDAEWVFKSSPGSEIAVDGVALGVRGSLGQGLDDLLNILGCNNKASQSMRVSCVIYFDSTTG